MMIGTLYGGVSEVMDMRLIGRILLLALVLGVIPACRSVYPRSAPQPTPISVAHTGSVPADTEETTIESMWPARWGVDVVTEGTTVGIIVELDHPASQLVPAHLSRFHRLRTGETEYSDSQALAAGMGMDQPYKFQPEGPGCYLFVHQPPLDESVPTPSKDQEPDLAFKFISAQRTSEAADHGTEDQIELERTWLTYRSPTKEQDSAGLVVLLPGMFGTPEPVINGVEKYLRAKGWSVLRMLSHPSRFTQRQQFAVVGGDEAKVAGEIAHMFDTRAAEAAYAASASVRFVHDRYPGDADKPVVLLGMSGGAMVLPTVYAFEPSLYSAGVLIAGGGNFLEINIRSNYSKWIDSIDLDGDPSDPEIQEPERAQLQELARLYMTMSKLDSLHTAESMRGVPVLMLHGSTDKAVPASTGDALYQALGKPERWVYPVGHELIFAGLPLQVPKIEKWIRGQVLDAED